MQVKYFKNLIFGRTFLVLAGTLLIFAVLAFLLSLLSVVGHSTAQAGVSYERHFYTKCVGPSIYWFDSSNRPQDLHQTCALGQTCSGNQCVGQAITPYAPHAYLGCVGNVSYWYDSSKIRQEVYKNCS